MFTVYLDLVQRLEGLEPYRHAPALLTCRPHWWNDCCISFMLCPLHSLQAKPQAGYWGDSFLLRPF